MRQGIIAIYDKDMQYAYHLMEYLNERVDFFLEARVFTNFISLQEFLEREMIEILLIGEQIQMDELWRKQVRHIMILSECGVDREHGEYPCLYKFQSMDKLVKELMLCLEDSAVKVVEGIAQKREKTKLIGVFSPFGGCGKTLFSLALGQALTAGGTQKALYIGMELVSSFWQEEEASGETMSDILYWVRERKEGCLRKPLMMAEKKGGLSFLFSPDHYEDLLDVAEEDIQFFLQELYRESSYETIIFDIGCWNQSMFFLLEQMDEIYVPDFLNRRFLKKEEGIVESLRLVDKETLYHRMKKVELPFDEMIYQGDYELDRLDKTKMGQYVCRLTKSSLI